MSDKEKFPALEIYDAVANWYQTYRNERAQQTPSTKLPVDHWVYPLFKQRNDLKNLRESLDQNQRKTIAVWGPSQSGKSSMLTRYIDRHTIKNEDKPDSEHGKSSGLHWQGGEPFCFDCFTEGGDTVEHLEHKALNPITGGSDATGLVCRFTIGTTDPTDTDHYQINDSRFPVELKLATRKDLLQIIAQGYLTEVEDANLPIELNGDELEQMSEKETPCSQAIELLLDFCEVMEVMAPAEYKRYKSLIKELSSQTSEVSHAAKYSRLFSSKVALNIHSAKEFVYKTLWSGDTGIGQSITRDYERILKTINKYRGQRIYCSLSVARLLINMSLPPLAFIDENSIQSVTIFKKDYIRLRNIRVSSMGTQDLHLYLQDTELYSDIQDSQNFSNHPDDRFDPVSLCDFQSAISEVVIPLNPSHLTQELDSEDKTSLGQLLDEADILDFPGIANPKNEDPLDTGTPREDVAEEDHAVMALALNQHDGDAPTPLNAYSKICFYYRIIKRGKTAAMFQTFACNRGIDHTVITHCTDGKNDASPCHQITSALKTFKQFNGVAEQQTTFVWTALHKVIEETATKRQPLIFQKLNNLRNLYKDQHDTIFNKSDLFLTPPFAYSLKESRYEVVEGVYNLSTHVLESDAHFTRLLEGNADAQKSISKMLSNFDIKDGVNGRKTYDTGNNANPECIGDGGSGFIFQQLRTKIAEIQLNQKFDQIRTEIETISQQNLQDLLSLESLWPEENQDPNGWKNALEELREDYLTTKNKLQEGSEDYDHFARDLLQLLSVPQACLSDSWNTAFISCLKDNFTIYWPASRQSIPLQSSHARMLFNSSDSEGFKQKLKTLGIFAYSSCIKKDLNQWPELKGLESTKENFEKLKETLKNPEVGDWRRPLSLLLERALQPSRVDAIEGESPAKAIIEGLSRRMEAWCQDDFSPEKAEGPKAKYFEVHLAEAINKVPDWEQILPADASDKFATHLHNTTNDVKEGAQKS